MAKFGINDILNAKTKAAGQQAQGYKEIYLSPYEVKAAEENTHQKLEGIEEQLFTRRAGAANGFGKGKWRIPHN
jgi:hypothetical protein